MTTPFSPRKRHPTITSGDRSKIIYFWGSNTQPSIVEGISEHKLAPDTIASSGRHFATVTTCGKLIMWGRGTSGQLGNGGDRDSKKPIFVDFFDKLQVTQARCAAAQSAAITSDGALYVWGWFGGEPVKTPKLVADFTKKRVTKVSLGAYHVMALVDSDERSGALYTWGNNGKGQLGNGKTELSLTPVLVESLQDKFIADICASETSSGIITDTGSVWVWGSNSGGIMLGINCSDEVVPLPSEIEALSNVSVMQLSFGIEFGAVLSGSGEVLTWGRNTQGQLGVGDRANRTLPEPVIGLQGIKIVGISCGGKSMMAWSDSEIFSWGANDKNQLGHPDIKDVPYLSQPKKIQFPVSTIILDACCGNDSLVLTKPARIQVTYQDQVHEEVVSTEKTVSDLKTTVCPLWKLEPMSIVLQDSYGQVLNQKMFLKDLIIQERNILRVILKEDQILDDKEDIKFQLDVSDVPAVKAGSIPQLVNWLINPRFPSEDFLQSFLITYRMFMSPLNLLDQLIESYCIPPSFTKSGEDDEKSNQLFHELQRLRIIEVLRNWITQHSADFFSSKIESTQLLTKLHRFIDEVITQQDRDLAIELTRLYHQMDPKKQKKQKPLRFAPESLKRIHSGEISLTSYPMKEVARQLCLVSHAMFSAIEVKELIGLGWMKPDKQTRAPNVIKMIHHSNKVSSWVCTTILSQASTKKRIKMYEKFVDLSMECLDLQNYNSLMEIIGGLQSNSLLKYSKNWPNFSPSTNPYVEKVEALSKMLIARNKAELRLKLKTIEPPAVPFLGMFLGDLLFLEDGNKDQIDGLINFRKCSLVATTIKSIQHFQKTPYEFHPVQELKEYLELREENAIKRYGESEPAEVQLTFLNNTSSILADRKKTTDLQGERAAMWIQWCEKIDNYSVVYTNEDGTTRTFLEILLESYAIENSLYSVLMNYPRNEFELKLLRRIIELCFIPELNVDDLIELLHLGRKLSLPGPLRAIFVQAICTFKNIVPHHSIYPSISKYDDKLQSKDDSDDLSVLRGKRRKCNRAAIKLCKIATLMITGNDNMEVFPLLYRGLHPNHLQELRNYTAIMREQIVNELELLREKQKSILPLTGQDNETVRSLEQKKRQIDTSIKEIEKRKEDIQQETVYIFGEIEKFASKQARYYEELSALIEKQKVKMERLTAVESMIIHVISLTESKQDNSDKNLEDTAAASVSALTTYFDKQKIAMKALRSKLETIARDVEVMGARYGTAVTKALQHDYQKTQQTFALSLNHLDFAFSTLAELQQLAILLPDNSPTKKKLRLLASAKTEIENLRDSIIATHIPKK